MCYAFKNLFKDRKIFSFTLKIYWKWQRDRDREKYSCLLECKKKKWRKRRRKERMDEITIIWMMVWSSKLWIMPCIIEANPSDEKLIRYSNNFSYFSLSAYNSIWNQKIDWKHSKFLVILKKNVTDLFFTSNVWSNGTHLNLWIKGFTSRAKECLLFTIKNKNN